MQYHLGGMNKDETSAYIRHHMTVSQTEKPVFAESALGRIFAASQGLPRVVNQICTQILLDATARNLEVIVESDVVRVLADMDRQRGLTNSFAAISYMHISWRMPSLIHRDGHAPRLLIGDTKRVGGEIGSWRLVTF